MMDVPRGLRARHVTLDKRRWVVSLPPVKVSNMNNIPVDNIVVNTNIEMTTQNDISIVV